MLDLLAKRLEVASEIGLTKRKDGLRTRDSARERQVAARFADKAEALGMDRSAGRALSKLLITSSVAVQHRSADEPLHGKTALVVGGSGKMGEWTCRFLSNRGADVRVWDPRGRLGGYVNVKDLGPSAARSDIVVVAGPPGVCPEELRAVIAAGPDGLVFDLCSVKAHVSGILKDAVASGMKVTSVHPMFGPKAASPKGLNVLVCGCGCRRADDEAARLFRGAGAKVVRIGVDGHDGLMAYVLGLSHVAALVFGSAARSSGMSAKELRAVQGTTFAKLAGLALDVSGESRRVYHDIQALNPDTAEMLEAVERALAEVKEAALDPSPVRFTKIMDDDKDYLEK
jgi:chorismate mutase/prephenate dehydrogenase